MSEENRNVYNISHLGGNFNQSIQGNYTEVHGNYIDTTQDLSQAAAQIQELLIQLQSQGYSETDAQQKVANDWANKARNDLKTKGKLVKLGKYINNAAANGLIGQAAVEAIKLALKLSGIPLP
ncbi:hypothetical protein [Mastigocoleus sp. MO_188.B34]|uniref:hypothetical protein n=1 Tax=Mastigocoleus sp. MO_188.B34 TaxID=3036635 RepID=UPI002608D423|nr:hypothetical protein [Mastigocoleus sp. MO_188.B34]MDJ0697067.1 hypothetical protein [Mastigocoleus sp. MO_188.B34]